MPCLYPHCSPGLKLVKGERFVLLAPCVSSRCFQGYELLNSTSSHHPAHPARVSSIRLAPGLQICPEQQVTQHVTGWTTPAARWWKSKLDVAENALNTPSLPNRHSQRFSLPVLCPCRSALLTLADLARRPSRFPESLGHLPALWPSANAARGGLLPRGIKPLLVSPCSLLLLRCPLLPCCPYHSWPVE